MAATTQFPHSATLHPEKGMAAGQWGVGERMQPRGRGAWDGAQDGAQLCHSHETSLLSASVSLLVEVRDKILKSLRFLLPQTCFHLAPSRSSGAPGKIKRTSTSAACRHRSPARAAEGFGSTYFRLMSSSRDLRQPLLFLIFPCWSV